MSDRLDIPEEGSVIGERELWATIDSLRRSMGEHHGNGIPVWEKWCEDNGVNWEELRAAANAYLPSFKTWLDGSCLAEAATDMWLHAFQIGFLVAAPALRNQGAEEERRLREEAEDEAAAERATAHALGQRAVEAEDALAETLADRDAAYKGEEIAQRERDQALAQGAEEERERLRAEGEKSVRWKCPVHGFAAGANVCQVLDDPSKTNDESDAKQLEDWVVKIIAHRDETAPKDRLTPSQRMRLIGLTGSTGCAAVLEGFDLIGIEREPEYVAIAQARIVFWSQHEGKEVEEVLGILNRSQRDAKGREENGQGSLLALATSTEAEGAS